MTVLVLDHPDLMRQLAGLSANLTTDSNNRPHRLRFHYGFNQHCPTDEDADFLRRHGAWLRDNPAARVKLHSHTDNFGSDEYNQFLSRKRAATAMRILMSEGARESQITLCCRGSSTPLTRPEDHGANRRLELEYLEQTMACAL